MDREIFSFFLPYLVCDKKKYIGAKQEIDESRINSLNRLMKVGAMFIFGEFETMTGLSFIKYETGYYTPISTHKFFGYYLSQDFYALLDPDLVLSSLFFKVVNFKVEAFLGMTLLNLVLVSNVIRDYMIFSGESILFDAIKGYISLYRAYFMSQMISSSMTYLNDVVIPVLGVVSRLRGGYRLGLGDLYYKGDNVDLKRFFYFNNVIYKDRTIKVSRSKDEWYSGISQVSGDYLIREVMANVDVDSERGAPLTNSLESIVLLKKLRNKDYVVSEGRNYFMLRKLPAITNMGNKKYVEYNTYNSGRTSSKWDIKNKDLNESELQDGNLDISSHEIRNRKSVYLKKSDNDLSPNVKKKIYVKKN